MPDCWYVYMLECKDGSYYTGITCDLYRRLDEHNSSKGGCRYTRTRKPVKLLAAWQTAEQGAALQAEYFIKKRLHHQQKKVIIADQQKLMTLLPNINLWPYSLDN